MYHRLINEDEPEDHWQNDQNTYELKNRNRDRRSKTPESNVDHEPLSKVDFVYHTIKPNETLQGIALRYACTVSKLRFYNHLMTDNSFHGLSVIKIPVLKNGVLKEQFGQQTAPDPSSVQFVDDLVDVSDPNGSSSTPKTQVINIGISNYLSNNGKLDQKFLQNLSDDFKEIRKSTLLKMESTSGIGNGGDALQAGDHLTSRKVTTNSSAFASCDGSDFGIHWRYLILVLIIICLLVPSFVLFNLEHHNSTDSTNYVHADAMNINAHNVNISM